MKRNEHLLRKNTIKEGEERGQGETGGGELGFDIGKGFVLYYLFVTEADGDSHKHNE